MPVERLSIELTNRCAKACAFCYNASGPRGETRFSADDIVAFVEDAAHAGTKAVSLGGGEPLQHDGVFEILARLEGTLFRSVTTNGLLLDGPLGDALVAARPDKVHVSELEPAVGARLSAVRLPGCYGDAAELQPAQHVSCEGWLPAWLDEARRRAHPIALQQYGTPRDDGDYARYIEHVRDELAARGITWDPR